MVGWECSLEAKAKNGDKSHRCDRQVPSFQTHH